MNRLGWLAFALVLGGCQQATDVARTLPIPGVAGSLVRGGAEALPAARGAFVDMEEPEEIELGRAVTTNIGSRYRLLRDASLTRYVALVGNTVAAHSERPDVKYYFGVLDAPEVNAFAAPGGYVFITVGALRLMKDEAALAGVLGHEVAHVARRHHQEAIKAERRKQIAMIGVREGLAYTPAAAFGGVISMAADKVADQVILKGFSRAEEGDADQAGFRYAAAAGYDPAGLGDFLAALVAGGEKEATATRFFSTHPGTPERLQEQRKLIAARSSADGRRNPERFTQNAGQYLAPPPAR
ncbi:MAG TPA: M48 family metalloprotease [Methylomirabilota bacterium]|nr:M48 family metalloprotease [Methylomirabilota bacterium]